MEIATCLMELGQFQEAIEYLFDVAALKPEDDSVDELQSQCLKNLNTFENLAKKFGIDY